MLSSFINAAVCSQHSFSAAVAFVLAHRLADVNEEDEMTTMYTMFLDALSGTRASTLADLLAVRTRVRLSTTPPHHFFECHNAVSGCFACYCPQAYRDHTMDAVLPEHLYVLPAP